MCASCSSKGKKQNHNKGNTNTSALLKGWESFLLLFFGNNLQTEQVKRFRKTRVNDGRRGKIINILHGQSATPSRARRGTVVKRIMQHYDISMNIQ